MTIGAVVALALSYGTLNSAYDAWIGHKQDECVFGSVSNQRYREWLARAEGLKKQEGAIIDANYIYVASVGRALRANNVRFERLTAGQLSLDDRLAAMHAMMRAAGFRLSSVNPASPSPFEDAQLEVRFIYVRFAWVGLIYACLAGCEYRTVVHYYIKGQKGLSPGQGDDANKFNFVLRQPNPEAGRRPPERRAVGNLLCPPVPPAGWTNQK